MEDDLESASAGRATDQLKAVAVRLVPSHLVVGEKALHCFLESHVMGGKFIRFKVILEVRRRETMPVDHDLLRSRFTYYLAYRAPRPGVNGEGGRMRDEG